MGQGGESLCKVPCPPNIQALCLVELASPYSCERSFNVVSRHYRSCAHATDPGSQRFSSPVPWLIERPTHLQYIYLLYSFLLSKMHPLPPPPNRTSDKQTAPTRPSAAPIQVTSAGSGPNNQSLPQGYPETKKKRKHRGKKSKRNRRQSFAAPSEESSIPSAIPEITADQNGMDRSNSGFRQPFYKLGQSGGNLSNTSLESEALLDHR